MYTIVVLFSRSYANLCFLLRNWITRYHCPRASNTYATCYYRTFYLIDPLQSQAHAKFRSCVQHCNPIKMDNSQVEVAIWIPFLYERTGHKRDKLDQKPGCRHNQILRKHLKKYARSPDDGPWPLARRRCCCLSAVCTNIKAICV